MLCGGCWISVQHVVHVVMLHAGVVHRLRRWRGVWRRAAGTVGVLLRWGCRVGWIGVRHVVHGVVLPVGVVHCLRSWRGVWLCAAGTVHVRLRLVCRVHCRSGIGCRRCGVCMHCRRVIGMLHVVHMRGLLCVLHVRVIHFHWRRGLRGPLQRRR
ncbi:hypothetical protein Xcc1_36550 [Xanthomonas campestris pv. campestris]|nr:hypothetical protein Xcc1_36550 [Xanthomonas campestris pv. campestris]